MHPEFDASVLIPRETQGHPTDHDLVLVKLEGTAKITPWVQLICLPEVSFEPSPGERCVVTGWGVTSGKLLCLFHHCKVWVFRGLIFYIISLGG